MQKLGRRIGGVAVTILMGTTAFAAFANPGGGKLVAIDEPLDPDVVIQELRVDNADATHVPVKVRVSIPAEYTDEGRALRWAGLTAYLTKTTSVDDDRLTEETIKLGAQWSNRSVIIEVPSPGEGHYFVHVVGELHFDDRTSATLTTTSTQRVFFSPTQDCADVKEVEIPGVGPECAVLFATKSSAPVPANDRRLAAANRKILDTIAKNIDDLCANDALHRVSVRGWASPLHSVDPTNEELAQMRADGVWRALHSRVAGCKDRLHDDSGPGVQAVTKQFGKTDNDNQCVQIRISSHSCVK